jgi:hypothetical protein
MTDLYIPHNNIAPIHNTPSQFFSIESNQYPFARAPIGYIDPVVFWPVDNPLLEPVSLFHTRDYGDYLMVRAANMKISIEKLGLRIVNISGGGCPDVPYLAQEMIGKTLYDTPHPRTLGHTLCGYALALAHEELCKQCLQYVD